VTDAALRHREVAWTPIRAAPRRRAGFRVGLPGRAGGARVTPGQDAALPDGVRWHLRLRAHGRSNALCAPDGATTIWPASTALFGALRSARAT
jgi:hypothetical protein